MLPLWLPVHPPYAPRQSAPLSPVTTAVVEEVEANEAVTWRTGSSWRLRFAPAEVLYPSYVADPRRPNFSFTLINTSESEIDAAGDSINGVRMGTSVGILQLHPTGDPGGGFQLAAHMGFLAQFDRDEATDNLGWDGLYGFHLSWVAHDDLVLRVGMAHDSSHLGDEYIEKTGRQRIGYTREELLAGVRYSPLESLTGYLEYGQAYHVGNDDLMEKGRVEFGLEFESKPWLLGRRLAPFAALDVSAYEEDDWEENLSVQLGVLHFASGLGGAWRFGVEYYDGRSPIGEFFQERQRHFAWGFWLDL